MNHREWLALQQNHGVPRLRRWHVLAFVMLYCAIEYFYPSL